MSGEFAAHLPFWLPVDVLAFLRYHGFMKKIPLHSLVILIDTNTPEVLGRFPEHEIVSLEKTQKRLFGNGDRPDLRKTFLFELKREMATKLNYGERVVVNIPDLRREARIELAKIAADEGLNVIYVVDDLTVRRDLQKGDNIADVVDIKRDKYEVVLPFNNTDLVEQAQARGFAGITVIADVHGMRSAMQNAVAWARSRNHLLLFLGDLLDYGRDSLETVSDAYVLVTRGEAEVLRGNHERKIYRYLIDDAGKVRLSEGNKITTNRVESLGEFEQARWRAQFFGLYHLSRNHRVAGKFIFAHGAVSREMWTIHDRTLSGRLEELTMFGEVDNSVKRGDGFPNRVYNWVDDLEHGQTAIVGHEIRSTFEPFTHEGKLGGKAIFLDTGCGKTGHLSSVDIRFVDGEAKIENFNFH